MLQVRVSTTESSEGIREMVISRPYYTYGVAIMVLLAVLSYLMLSDSLVNVVVWLFLGYTGLGSAEERIKVTPSELVIGKGIWFARKSRALQRKDISEVKVSKTKETTKKGLFDFWKPLSIVIKKRKEGLLGGASANDAELVASWLNEN